MKFIELLYLKIRLFVRDLNVKVIKFNTIFFIVFILKKHGNFLAYFQRYL